MLASLTWVDVYRDFPVYTECTWFSSLIVCILTNVNILQARCLVVNDKGSWLTGQFLVRKIAHQNKAHFFFVHTCLPAQCTTK